MNRKQPRILRMSARRNCSVLRRHPGLPPGVTRGGRARTEPHVKNARELPGTGRTATGLMRVHKEASLLVRFPEVC